MTQREIQSEIQEIVLHDGTVYYVGQMIGGNRVDEFTIWHKGNEMGNNELAILGVYCNNKMIKQINGDYVVEMSYLESTYAINKRMLERNRRELKEETQ